MVGRNIVGRIRPLRVAGGGERKDRKGPDPTAFEEVLHGGASVLAFILRQAGNLQIGGLGARTETVSLSRVYLCETLPPHPFRG